MHELGIVFAMIDQLEDVAKEQHLAHIQKVTVDLGEVSGIVTDFFEDAWTWAANKNELTEGAELEVCHRARCHCLQRLREDLWNGRAWPHLSLLPQ